MDENRSAGGRGKLSQGRKNTPLIWSPNYEVDIGAHVFPTAKYRLVHSALLQNRDFREQDFSPPTPASWEELAAVHAPEYLDKIRNGLADTSRHAGRFYSPARIVSDNYEGISGANLPHVEEVTAHRGYG